MGRKLHLIILDEGKYHIRGHKAVSSHPWYGISFRVVVVVFSEIGLYYHNLYFKTISTSMSAFKLYQTGNKVVHHIGQGKF